MRRQTIREILVPVAALMVIAIGETFTFYTGNPISRALGFIALLCIGTGAILTVLLDLLDTKRENALTSEELAKLKQYLAMVENKTSFTLVQAKNFDRIAQKLSETRDDWDIGKWAIGAIATLTLESTKPENNIEIERKE